MFLTYVLFAPTTRLSISEHNCHKHKGRHIDIVDINKVR